MRYDSQKLLFTICYVHISFIIVFCIVIYFFCILLLCLYMYTIHIKEIYYVLRRPTAQVYSPQNFKSYTGQSSFKIVQLRIHVICI